VSRQAAFGSLRRKGPCRSTGPPCPAARPKMCNSRNSRKFESSTAKSRIKPKSPQALGPTLLKRGDRAGMRHRPLLRLPQPDQLLVTPPPGDEVITACIAARSRSFQPAARYSPDLHGGISRSEAAHDGAFSARWMSLAPAPTSYGRLAQRFSCCIAIRARTLASRFCARRGLCYNLCTAQQKRVLI
jgi:hypothetical protein